MEDRNMKDNSQAPGSVYRIVVDGTIDSSWLAWFGNVSLQKVDRQTVLVATVPDQAALRGILDRMWDLNLVVLSVTCLTTEPLGSGNKKGGSRGQDRGG
jgi:hypothetical protein